MRQALGPGALGKPRGSGWRGRWEGGIGMGNTCKPMAVSFQCMTKSTTIKKKKNTTLVTSCLLGSSYKTPFSIKLSLNSTKSLQSCLILCNPMDCILPGPSIHGIFQARILEWIVMPSSRRSPGF